MRAGTADLSPEYVQSWCGERFAFAVCPKLAVFSAGRILVARRAGESDLDGVLTLVGGKLETTDLDVLSGIRREFSEEICSAVVVRVLVTYAVVAEFTKRDGTRMLLPHYYAELLSGTVSVGSEYSGFLWLTFDELESRTDVYENVATICRQLARLASVSHDGDYVRVAT